MTFYKTFSKKFGSIFGYPYLHENTFKRPVTLFYFVRSLFHFLVVGLSVESCFDDNEEKIVND